MGNQIFHTSRVLFIKVKEKINTLLQAEEITHIDYYVYAE